MGMIRAAVFDLDDTLYLERDYVSSGFRALANELARRSPLQNQEIFDFLWERFQAGARGDHFDRLLERYPELSTVTTVAELVSLYRNHLPCLELLDGVRAMLEKLESLGVQTGIITDGPVSSQTAKIGALGLVSKIEHRIQTDEWGIEYRKPHLRGYETMTSLLGAAASQCVYVGDNPEKDFVGAKALGWKTIRLRMPDQLRCQLEAKEADFAAQVEVKSVADLSSLLLTWCSL
jgi:putative hydrolase of the HAD superfamily